MTQTGMRIHEPPAQVAPERPTDQNESKEKPVVHIHHVQNTSAKLKLVNLAAVVIPFIGFLTAVILLWGVAFDWVYLGILAGMYLVTGLGITVGYHRHFTHKSFNAPKPVTAALAIFGSMAVEGPVIQWAGMHRRHHQHSDQDEDPHSPHLHGDDLWSMLKGMWHAHVGWMIDPDTRGIARYTRDLRNDPLVRKMSKLFPLWVLAGLVIPAALGGLLTMSWMGVLLGFLWGGLVRIFLVHHVTWSVNSVCHIWGSKPFRSHDESRNNAIFGVLALGEGWHNNHHAFPASARHGLRWWQFDASYVTIWLMSKIGLASNVRVPTKERMDAKRAE